MNDSYNIDELPFATPLMQTRHDAQSHLLARRWREAAECLHMLAAITPNDPWVRQWQVITALSLHRADDAIEFARLALAIPGHMDKDIKADIWFNLGHALSLTGQYPAALDAFEQAIALEPTMYCALEARDNLRAAGMIERECYRSSVAASEWEG
jgi:tetratricopeptide (TPR) repeat protein